MNLEQKLKILLNKLSTGNFDDVIFEATYLDSELGNISFWENPNPVNMGITSRIFRTAPGGTCRMS